jgi:hypothetical protein
MRVHYNQRLVLRVASTLEEEINLNLTWEQSRKMQLMAWEAVPTSSIIMKLFSITSLPTQEMTLKTSITIPVAPTIQVRTIQYRTSNRDHLPMQLIIMVVEVTQTMRGRLTMLHQIVGTLKETVTCLRTFHFMTRLWKRMKS